MLPLTVATWRQWIQYGLAECFHQICVFSHRRLLWSDCRNNGLLCTGVPTLGSTARHPTLGMFFCQHCLCTLNIPTLCWIESSARFLAVVCQLCGRTPLQGHRHERLLSSCCQQVFGRVQRVGCSISSHHHLHWLYVVDMFIVLCGFA